MNELITALFAARDYAHLHHLKERRLGKHTALASFYEGLIGKLDALTELWLRDDRELQIPETLVIPKADVYTYFRKMSDAIQGIMQEQGMRESIKNVLAEIQAEFDYALYKLSLEKEYLSDSTSATAKK